MKKNDQELYKSLIDEIYRRRNLSVEVKSAIKKIHNKLASKNMTEDGKKRKKICIERLFFERLKTKLYLNFYISVLPLLKKYVLLFEMKEPSVHLLNDKQVELFKEFLVCFCKPEMIRHLSAKQLKTMKITEEFIVKKRDMYVGGRNVRIIAKEKRSQDVIDIFLELVSKCYMTTANYLQIKLPLDNPLLSSISAIDPAARGHNTTIKYLAKLPDLIPNVLTENEIDDYLLQIRKYQIERNLPIEKDSNGSLIRIDHWWGEIENLKLFPALSKLVLAILTCFHGPQVESSFNTMNDIIDERSGRTDIETYNAIQTVKYHLKAEHKNSIEMFSRTVKLQDPINRALCNNFRSASSKYRENLKQKRDENESRKRKLNITVNKAALSKKKAKIILQKKAEKERLKNVKN